ncbi:toxin VasX [Vibrio genomosp. F6]|uniref:Toxin VasX N-terminal region domain-containing protein n=1 Tax=Vibrio genomosp. F6 str. FF-238 TaxID=1191298 RepID=A0A1E5CWX3_9VIBR|nr:toxin VasX [Vibrio genomosp. F6]OEE75041.1 hypothetical protein A130_17370 [Vibrio genomosp. F6 str. FF-238]
MSDSADAQAKKQPSERVGSVVGICPLKTESIEIVPIRYAIDEYAEDKKQPNPLPAYWRGSPFFSDDIKENSFTLRQLRDGWLYVCKEDGTPANQFHEYQVSGANLIKYDWLVCDGPRDQRGSAGKTSTVLTYNKRDTLWLAFSKNRWSGRVCEHMRSNSSSRYKWMRRLNLASYCHSLSARHVGALTDLAQAVSDIDVSAVQDNRFAGMASNTSKDSDVDNEFKPVASENSYISQCQDIENAIFIALDDVIADLTNITTHLACIVSENRQFQEEEGNKIFLAQQVLDLTLAKASDDFVYPVGVNTEAVKRNYYEKVTELFDLKEEVLNTNNKRGYGYTDEKAIKKLTEEIKKTYGAEPKGDLVAWYRRKKYREVVDWKWAQKEYDDLLTKSEKRIEIHQKAANDLIASLARLDTNPMACFLDNQCAEDQIYLQSIFANIVEVITQNISEKHAKWLLKDFESPNTLLALSLSGYSMELHKAIGEQFIDPETNSWIQASDMSNVLARRNDLMSFITHSEIENSILFQGVSKSVQKVALAFNHAISSTVSSGSVKLISIMIAGLSPSMINSNGVPNAGFTFRSFFAQRYATQVKLTVTAQPEYQHQLKGWQQERAFAFEEVTATNRAINNGIKRGLSELDMIGLEQKYHIAVDKYHQVSAASPFAIAVDNPQMMVAVRQNIAEVITNKGKVLSGSAWDFAGGFAGIVAILNVWSMSEAINTIAHNNNPSSSEYQYLAQTAGYSAAAFVAIFQGKAWGKISYDASVMSMRVSYWKTATPTSSISMGMIKQSRSFIRYTTFAAGFGVVAGFFESKALSNEQEQAIGFDKYLLFSKKIAVFAMMGANIGQLVVRIAPQFLNWGIGAFLAPWIVSTLLVAGFAYLLITMIQNSLYKDEFQQWLQKTPWGNKDQLNITSESMADSLLELKSIMLKPSLYIVSRPKYEATGHLNWEGYPEIKQSKQQIELQLAVSKLYEGQAISLTLDGQYMAKERLAGHWQAVNSPFADCETGNANIRIYTLTLTVPIQRKTIKMNVNFDGMDYCFVVKVSSSGYVTNPVVSQTRSADIIDDVLARTHLPLHVGINR